jgi:hypothetical protein
MDAMKKEEKNITRRTGESGCFYLQNLKLAA